MELLCVETLKDALRYRRMPALERLRRSCPPRTISLLVAAKKEYAGL
jgi:hypothetical protein